ncbi:MAG: hypothetical protein ABI663_16670 [Chryseolinea sp.]
MKTLLTIILFASVVSLHAQDKTLPCYEIPSYPETFTSGGIAARVVDGLGFRFYWATEGLREGDLVYKSSVDARTSQETIEHIFEMSYMVLNATTHKANVQGQEGKLPFVEMRKKTLENFKEASDRLRKASDADFNTFKLIFKLGDKTVEYPFWHLLNGPMSDCIWHVGQVVSFRRSFGNPFSDKVDLFRGTLNK